MDLVNRLGMRNDGNASILMGILLAEEIYVDIWI